MTSHYCETDSLASEFACPRHLGSGDTDTLTSPSKELKEFSRKFAGDKTVFKPESTFIFKRVEARAS
jgi:hypothetical protein